MQQQVLRAGQLPQPLSPKLGVQPWRRQQLQGLHLTNDPELKARRTASSSVGGEPPGQEGSKQHRWAEMAACKGQAGRGRGPGGCHGDPRGGVRMQAPSPPSSAFTPMRWPAALEKVRGFGKTPQRG